MRSRIASNRPKRGSARAFAGSFTPTVDFNTGTRRIDLICAQRPHAAKGFNFQTGDIIEHANILTYEEGKPIVLIVEKCCTQNIFDCLTSMRVKKMQH